MKTGDLKSKTIQDVLSDSVLKSELKNEYLTELNGFKNEGNKQDPYNEGHLCTDVIPEVEAETQLGLEFLSSFIKVAISVDEGWDELEGFDSPIAL